LTSPVHAWNSLGHKVVAEIAWRQLKPEQRQAIVAVLREHPRFEVDFTAKMELSAEKGDKAIKDHWIFQHAAAWPETIRKTTEVHKPWRYIDLPVFLDSDDLQAFADNLPANISTVYPGKVPIDEYNVVQAIQHHETLIRSNAAPAVKAVAYC